MPRGEVGDVLRQPRREGYSCLDLHSGGTSHGSYLFSLVLLPGCQGDGVPLSSVSSWDIAVSFGPVVDGADGTVESVNGLVEGARSCICSQAGINSHGLSVLLVQLDILTEGLVEEFDGAEGLFLSHIRTGVSTGDSSADVLGLGFGGFGKAVLGGEGFDLSHGVEVSNCVGGGVGGVGELDGGGNAGDGNEAGSSEHLLLF